MKHLFTLVLFSALFFSASGQSLSFSRVVNIAGDCTAGTRNDTVPAGKAWKIQSIRSEDINVNLSANGSNFERINFSADTYPLIAPGAQTSNTVVSPIWLAENTILQSQCFSSLNTDYYFYSILEFEIVP